MKRFRFKPNKPIHAVVGMEDGNIYLFGFHNNEEEARESRDNLANTRIDVVRRTRESMAAITGKPVTAPRAEVLNKSIDNNYRVIELNLNNPDKQIIWELD